MPSTVPRPKKEDVGQAGDRVAAGIEQRQAAGDAHRRQGDDDRRHAQVGDAGAVGQAEQRADRQRHHRPHREIDAAGQDGAGHAHRDDGIDRHLARHVGQVVDAEEAVVQQAHQHEQDSEADKRQDRRVMQQFFPALAEAGAGGAARHGGLFNSDHKALPVA